MDVSLNGLNRYAKILFLSMFLLIVSKLSQSNPPNGHELLVIALEQLRKAFFAGNEETKTPRIKAGKPKKTEESRTSAQDPEEVFVDIFVAFDEAQTLVKVIDKRNESRFIVLRRALSSLSSYPLFTFFLSTTGSITQFAHPREQDPSSRISAAKLSTPRPYIYLGFDQLMQSRNVFERWKTLEDVTSLECAAHMGRPL
jgi:hypothetical protein